MSPEASRLNTSSRGFRRLTLAASIATLVLVVVGGIVRVTGSGLGCPDWPLCYGQVLPPPQIESIIEWSHRFLAGSVGVMLLGIALVAWRSHRADRAVLLPALAGVGVLVVQSLLGAITVALELPSTIVAIHLGAALVMFACVLIVTVNVWRGGSGRGSASGVAIVGGDSRRRQSASGAAIVGGDSRRRQSASGAAIVGGDSRRRQSASGAAIVGGDSRRRQSASGAAIVGGDSRRRQPASGAAIVGGDSRRRQSASGVAIVGGDSRRRQSASGAAIVGGDSRRRQSASGDASYIRNRLISLAVGAAIAVYVLILLGATVTATGASLACPDWPLCQGQLAPALTDPLVTTHFTHRFAALASGVFIVLLAIQAWKAREQASHVWRWSLLLAGLFVAQVLVGGINVLQGMPIVLRALHLGLAASVWGAAVVLVALLLRDRSLPALVSAHAAAGDRIDATPDLRAAPNPAAQSSGKPASMFSKYLRLSKPWIIVLLLTTTLTSMLIAGRGAASLPLIVFTLLGGALASSGANAINCYIDRDIDGVMSRTKNRPIPRDQLNPRQALTFGLIASVASFAVLLVFVNLLAAVLAVFGILYYVFVYTRWLKRTTPHNIVIGGIAGAVPPLVGWAAVTGRLDLLALYLFLIVFYWTPPHTWALAILVRGDYEKAGVPMLPVARGEAETRRQIWLYSLQLVAVTLLVFAFRLAGGLYLALALALNGLFLWLALRLTREMDKPAAKRLYKYSQLYLALLFAALVIDASLV